MGFVLCQPHCWEVVSKPVALCQGVMDGAGSCRMLVILRHVGWQERRKAHVLVCKSDLGSSGAGKRSVCVCGCARNCCPAQHCFQRVKALGVNKETRLQRYPMKSHFFLSAACLCDSYKIIKGCLAQEFSASQFPTPNRSNTCGAQILL